ncbi:family 1 glycosylhydrolase [Segetibacter sp.]|uniref:family 1 glycosylhydrolase n=1 Tax=Segetibacter sp. TaxID=2231182 RepID=UPI0026167D44|nr:family 1 glycosylhydrolase [Segetibacter sp.]MCW3081582.1 dTDP-4-dehydrorhamnose reductase [Segetibacter sp.]
MKTEYTKNRIEIWGGLECSLNRVDDTYMDQLVLSGHYTRGSEDIKRFADLGIKALRYPILWEKHAAQKDTIIDWSYSEARLNELNQAGIEPIAGLVHHGSGPIYADFFDGSFAEGLGEYAGKVAAQFPWITYYTPVNEPLTTARFCGLYGHWYPHKANTLDFLKILLAECKGTVLAMQAIRKVNPNAKLVQTEDIGKTQSSHKLRHQADFENKRRWLSFDILAGKINKNHSLWGYLTGEGLTEEDFQFFAENPCPPDIMGVNHYVTSERYIDEKIEKFPAHTIGGNGIDVYADVEAVRVGKNEGPEVLFKEVWERFHLPIAITEVHLHCTREEQLRWFNYIWTAVNKLKDEGADIRAVTAWALLGSFDWCSLLTKPVGIYEPGLFDVRALAEPRPTALTKLVKSLAEGTEFTHPVFKEDGWWKRSCAVTYHLDEIDITSPPKRKPQGNPLIIIGKTGTLGSAFSRLCELRGIHHILLGRQEVDISDVADIERMVKHHNPWAIVNTAGYSKIDEAEKAVEDCFMVNSVAPKFLSTVCRKYGIQFVTYSSDLVFDGKKNNPYLESDFVSPLNIYGQSKAMAEENVLKNDPNALIIRTGAFFGPWDRCNFVHDALKSFSNEQAFAAPKDVTVSPTYVPDLVHTTLDLLIDEANGIWNISNKGSISWAMLAYEVANRSGYNPKHFRAVTLPEMNFLASRPTYSVLTTEKGFELPNLDNALDRFFREQEMIIM